jgi:hypothetical protein
MPNLTQPSRPRFAEPEKDPVTESPAARAALEGWDEDYPRPSRDYPEFGVISSDYTVNLGRWFEFATAHYGAILGPAIGFLFLFVAIYIGLYIGSVVFVLATQSPLGMLIGLLAMFCILVPLSGGMTYVCLAELKGRPWTFSDFFGGFSRWGALLLWYLLLLLAYLPFAVGAGMLLAAAIPLGDTGMLVAAILMAVVLYCAMVYVLLRLAVYSWHLILDKNFGALEAMWGSWTMSRGHFWSLFGITLLMMLINLAGALTCYVGLLFTVPLTSLVTTAGYLLATRRRPFLRSNRSGYG